MSQNKSRLSAAEWLFVVLMAGALVLPVAVALTDPHGSIRPILYAVAGVMSLVWIVLLLVCSRRREFIHSVLWNWLFPFTVFRKIDPAYRLIIMRWMAYVQLLIDALALVQYLR